MPELRADLSRAEELQSIDDIVRALIAASSYGRLDGEYHRINDLDIVTADNGMLKLSDFVTGLNDDGTLKTNNTYTYSKNGQVTQEIKEEVIG